MTITPNRDNLVEGVETVVVTISSSPNYIVGTSNTATVTIADDPVTVTVTATDPNAAESGADPDVFTFTRSNNGNLAASLNVGYSLSGSTAINGGDYQAIGTNVTIPANQTSATVTIIPVDDAIAEGPETVVLTISISPNYVIGTPGSATVTIADND